MGTTRIAVLGLVFWLSVAVGCDDEDRTDESPGFHGVLQVVNRTPGIRTVFVDGTPLATLPPSGEALLPLIQGTHTIRTDGGQAPVSILVLRGQIVTHVLQ